MTADSILPRPLQEMTGDSILPHPLQEMTGDSILPHPLQEMTGDSILPHPLQEMTGDSILPNPLQEMNVIDLDDLDHHCVDAAQTRQYANFACLIRKPTTGKGYMPRPTHPRRHHLKADQDLLTLTKAIVMMKAHPRALCPWGYFAIFRSPRTA